MSDCPAIRKNCKNQETSNGVCYMWFCSRTSFVEVAPTRSSSKPHLDVARAEGNQRLLRTSFLTRLRESATIESSGLRYMGADVNPLPLAIS